MRKWVVAVMLAGGCAVVGHTRVYTDFERLRFRVVTEDRAPTAGAVVAVLPDVTALAGRPTALVLRLANDGRTRREVRIAAGDVALGTVEVPPRREARVNLSVVDGAALAEAGSVEFRAAGRDWVLGYLEVANVHGYSTGLFEFMITPASAQTPRRLGALASVPTFALLVVLYGRWRRIAHDGGRVTHTVAATLVTIFLMAAFGAPFVSNFGVHLATHTFLVCLTVVYYPALAVVAREVLFPRARRFRAAIALRLRPVVMRVAARYLHATVLLLLGRVVVRVAAVRGGVRRGAVRVARWTWAQRIALVYAAAMVFFVTTLAKRYDPDTGLTSLIQFGERFEHRTLPAVREVARHIYPDSGGYDGQFYAQLAVDPLLQDPALREALDAPPYRARRILFSWTAYVAGLGRAEWIVHAYALQYVVMWLLLAWVMCRWFPPTSIRSLGLWFACLYSEGVVRSVLSTVPDGPSMLLLAFGVAAMERGRGKRAAGMVGVACLAKSTNLLWAPMVVGADDLRHREWRGVSLKMLLVAGPLTAWMLYLLLGSHELGGMAGSTGLRNFGPPFSAYAAKWVSTVAELRESGWGSFARFSLLALIGFTTQAATLLVVREWRDPWWRVGVGSVVLMAFLGPAVWEGNPGAVTRVLLPMTFAFNARLRGSRWFWPLFVLGNLAVLQSLEALRVPFWRYI